MEFGKVTDQFDVDVIYELLDELWRITSDLVDKANGREGSGDSLLETHLVKKGANLYFPQKESYMDLDKANKIHIQRVWESSDVLIRAHHRLNRPAVCFGDQNSYQEVITNLSYLFKYGAPRMEKELFNKIRSISIEILGNDGKTYDFLIKTVRVDIDSIESEKEDGNIYWDYSVVFFMTFDIIDMDSLSPPHEGEERGGTEYERVRRETRVGK